MTDDDMHILAGAYALNALSPEEFEPFVEHLNECESCAVEVREWQATLAELGESMAVAPPPELRTLVLAGASRLPQLPPLPGVPLPTVPPAGPAEPTEETTLTPRPARVAPRHVARPSRRRAWLAAAAAVLVIGGTAAGVAIWQNQQQQQPSQLTAQERIAQVIWAPDVEARTSQVKGGGTITVLASAERGEGVVLAEQMTSIPSTKDYQVWALNAAGKPRSLGLLPREPTTPRLLLPGIRDSDTIAITEEPAGGSPEPTPPVLVQVPLK
jgi:anti-sigma-K factor RskA